MRCHAASVADDLMTLPEASTALTASTNESHDSQTRRRQFLIAPGMMR